MLARVRQEVTLKEEGGEKQDCGEKKTGATEVDGKQVRTFLSQEKTCFSVVKNDLSKYS